MNKEFMNTLSKEDRESLSELFLNINRHILSRKPHIKKYNRLRKLHAEILESMLNYVDSDKYNPMNYSDKIAKIIEKEIENLKIGLSSDNQDDASIIQELELYKNHKDIPSVTEIFIQNKKFRNAEKVKLLEAMHTSYVGLFKIVKTDKEEGYVFLEDVFTHKKFKIIDIALSSTFVKDSNNAYYIYNRIITVDDISFGTGIHCHFLENDSFIKDFIKNHQYNKCCDLSRCFLLYKNYKANKNRIKFKTNHCYGR